MEPERPPLAGAMSECPTFPLVVRKKMDGDEVLSSHAGGKNTLLVSLVSEEDSLLSTKKPHSPHSLRALGGDRDTGDTSTPFSWGNRSSAGQEAAETQPPSRWPRVAGPCPHVDPATDSECTRLQAQGHYLANTSGVASRSHAGQGQPSSSSSERSWKEARQLRSGRPCNPKHPPGLGVF